MDDELKKGLDRLEKSIGDVERTHTLRAPCRQCGGTVGRIYTKNNQNVVFCRDCGRYAGYNAPKTETGEAPRTLQTIRHISPSQRTRILERALGRCELCASIELPTIAHFLSVKDGFDFLTDAEINSDENLIVLCAECNSGQSHRTGPLRLLAAILHRRANR
jgi:hypothetical protein